MTPPEPSVPLVLFDGPCNLCSKAVRFLLRHERSDTLRFASLQSEVGQEMQKTHHVPPDCDAMVFINQGSALTGSDAALALAPLLKFPWSLLGVFRFLPSRVHRALYRAVARRRYKWFGRQDGDSCPLPDPALSHRFLHS